MRIIPYCSEHLDELDDLGCQELLRPYLGSLKDAKYEDAGPAYTVVIGNRIIGAGGLFEMTQYRAAIWGLLSQTDLAQQFVPIHRAVLKFLNEQSYKRIDAQVSFYDAHGHRWVRMLGFDREVFCRAWAMPDGSSVSEYVRWG